MSRAAAAIAALLAAAPALARSPEVVPWQDAAAHIGQVVTVEGTVARATVGGGACTLEFAPDDPSAFRVVLMLALLSSPDAPDRLYSGRRVQASGRVQSFQGRPEMIIRRADQIELVDAAPATTTPPPAAPPPSTVPSSTLPPAPREQSPARAPCTRARSRLDAARNELAARADAAARCLRTAAPGCETERAAVTRALEDLAKREAEVDAACR